MAGAFQHHQGSYPGNTGNQLSPGSAASSLPSFKTNVNRTKTKRWVEAKSVSYDGDDWGDEDEYDEEEENSSVSFSQVPKQDTSPVTPSLHPSISRVSHLQQQPTLQPVQIQIPPGSSSGPHSRSIGTNQSSNNSRSLSQDRGSLTETIIQHPGSGTPAIGDHAQASDEGAGTAPEKPLVFVHPAEIYQHLQEERERVRQFKDPADMDIEPREEAMQSRSSDSAPSTTHQDYMFITDLKTENPPNISDQFPESPQHSALITLPEINQVASLGTDFLGDTDNVLYNSQSVENKEPTNHQEHSLQHNPSLGFRSVVHQAFDIPETVTRSNSDGTSVISPIISLPTLDERKTPTIIEELGEASASDPHGPAFKPGHRRDLSIPSPDNSPARSPIVSSSTHIEESYISAAQFSQNLGEQSADIEVHTLAEPIFQAIVPEAPKSPISTNAPGRGSLEGSNKHSTSSHSVNLPAVISTSEIVQGKHDASLEEQGAATPIPLRINSDQHPRHDYFTDDISPSIPSLSTETSPQDTESDRLRKEIIRSFSPDQLSSHSEGFRPQSIHYESTYLPHEYDSYWSEPSKPSQSSASLAKTLGEVNASVYSTQAPEQGSGDIPERSPTSPTTSAVEDVPLLALKKRFSWEDPDDPDSRAPPRQPPQLQEPVAPVPGSEYVAHVIQQIKEEPARTVFDEPFSHPKPHTSTELPSLSDQPLVGGVRAAIADQPASKSIAAQVDSAQQNISIAENEIPRAPQQETQSSPVRDQRQIEASLRGFREILDIKSSGERIRAFRESREQFAAIDSGLENWIRLTADALPEHNEVLQLNGQLPAGAYRPSLVKAKFPKLSSRTNFALPVSSHQDGNPQPPASGHARRPSGSPLSGMINRQNVEAKGKDLLHSAGVLGGKAGGAAKGLLAKGRNKFRSSGGADKGSLSMFDSPVDIQQKNETSWLHSPSEDLWKRKSEHGELLPRLPSLNLHERQTLSSAVSQLAEPGMDMEPFTKSEYSTESYSTQSTSTIATHGIYQRPHSGDPGRKTQNSATDVTSAPPRVTRHNSNSATAQHTRHAWNENDQALESHFHVIHSPPATTHQHSAAPHVLDLPLDQASPQPHEGQATPTRNQTEAALPQQSRVRDSLPSPHSQTTREITAAIGECRSFTSQILDLNQDDKVSSDGTLDSVAVSSPAFDRGPLGSTNVLNVLTTDGLASPFQATATIDQHDIVGNQSKPLGSIEDDVSRCNEESPSQFSKTHQARLDNPPPFPSPNADYPDEKREDEMPPAYSPSITSALNDVDVSARGLLTGYLSPPSPASGLSAQLENSPAQFPVPQRDQDSRPADSPPLSVPSAAVDDKHPDLRHLADITRAPRPDDSREMLPQQMQPYQRADQYSRHEATESDPQPNPQSAYSNSVTPNINEPQSDHTQPNPGSRSAQQASDIRSKSRPESQGATSSGSSFRVLTKKQNPDAVENRKSFIVNATRSRFNPQVTKPANLANPLSESFPTGSQPSKNKLKITHKFNRLSLPAIPSALTEVTKRNAFLKISGLFSRSSSQDDLNRLSKNQQSQTPKQRLQRHDLRDPASHANHVDQATENNPKKDPLRVSQSTTSGSLRSLSGAPPPPEGYYAPQRVSSVQEPSFIGGRRLAEHLAATASKRNRLSGDGGFHGVHNPPVEQPRHQDKSQQYIQRHQQPLSHGSTHTSLHSGISTASNISPTLPAQRSLIPESGRTHAQHLYLRSRSPKRNPLNTKEQTTPMTNYADPAYRLGAFESVPQTPRVGDQETPWPITLPDETGEKKRFTTGHQLPRIEQSLSPDLQRPVSPMLLRLGEHGPTPPQPSPAMSDLLSLSSSRNSPSFPLHTPSEQEPGISTVQDARHQDSTKDVVRPVTNPTLSQNEPTSIPSRNMEPVELPVPGDDSSEEIVMSSTAYPGQEWQPPGYSQWTYY